MPATATGTGAALVQLPQDEVSRRVRSLMVVPTDPAAQPTPQAGPNAPLASAIGGAGAEVYEANWEITTMTK